MSNQPPQMMNDETVDTVSLWGSCGEFSVPARAWRALRRLEHLYGLTPAGTKPLDQTADSVDLGTYGPDQIMTREDAQHLAQALERAFVDIPDGAATSDALVSADSGNSLLNIIQDLDVVKPYLRDFITHCRECGELWIWIY